MRVFIIGDSFSDNLFKKDYLKLYGPKSQNSEICKYINTLKLNNIESPLWFTDWLGLWGYEVHNFGTGGCSNEDIIYQFSKIDEFKEGDKLIVNLTHISRYNWYVNNGDVRFVHANGGGIDNTKDVDIHQEQVVYRDISYNEGYLKEKFLPFIDYLMGLHKNYKPILWTPFFDLNEKLKNSNFHWVAGLKDLPNFKLNTINRESNGFINDGHFGRYGNYMMANIFDEIIKNDSKNDIDLIKKNVTVRLNNSDIEFVNPPEWGPINYSKVQDTQQLH
jgi:hypothetical protein